MAPATGSTSRSNPLPKPGDAASAAAGGRITRLRAKESIAPAPSPSGTPARGAPSRLGTASTVRRPTTAPATGGGSGFLAKSKEGLRKVSGKSKEKESVNPKVKPSRAANNSPTYSESLQAYLRIRPSPTDSDSSLSARPYLELQSETDVLMRAPSEMSRHHIPKPPHIYSFDKVFPPTTSQSSFFTTTTLPLVEKLLQGENGLLFAYGVSNSGKSYTIQGGTTAVPSAADRGVLPRSIDVVFNSIEGLESKANLKPQGLADVVLSNEQEDAVTINDPFAATEPRVEDAVKVDRNFSYAVFVSYAEIFDLLDSVLPVAPPTPGPSRGRVTNNGLPRASHAIGLSGALNSSFNLAAMANGGGGILKRLALSLKNDPEGNGKYIAGLKDVRVRTREEALAVFRSGQSARQVFGTIANRESSRSHGIFTIKLVRIHNGAPEDPDSAQVSRLAIVDLAGSERTRNTQTTGDRLKEAGNINKSLMVLGQCLEVLRANQQKMATPATGAKKRLAVVPFRHSKLTEIFQNFFVGDGRAVIIVNVNPYDTGFDENSHVMRFSAIAREIQTTASNKVGFPLLKRQISTQFSAFKHAVSGPMKIKVTVPVIPKDDQRGAAADSGPSKKFATDRESQGFVMVEEELEVVEESEESEDEDDKDALVEYLFDQLKEMKTRLYESEMRNASIEVEVREEVAKEMQDSLQKMHDSFARQLNEQVAAHELKTDRKIDIITRTMTPAVHRIAQWQPSSSPASSYQTGDDSRADITMDDEESFESAIDASLLASGDDSMVSQESDPFVVKPSAKIPEVVITRESFQPARSDVRESTPIRSDAETSMTETEAETTRGDITLDSEVPDDNAEAVKPIDDPVSSEEESVVDTDDDEDEEADQTLETDDEDEDADETDEADEEEVDSDASAFTLSGEEDDEEASESEDSSPVRRASIRRRVTGSPTKLSSAKKAATPRTVKKAPASAKKVNAIFKSPPRSAKTPGEVLTPGPLSERVGQLHLDEDDEDDEDEMSVKTTTKKKRTLGKKVMTEDDMMAADRSSVASPDVRRMIRGGM